MGARVTLLCALGALALSGCAEEEEGLTGVSETQVVTQLTVARRDTEGEVAISEGVDLDGMLRACRQTDFVSPDGREGIDNQFIYLFEIIEEMFPDTIEGLIQGSINEGRLLMMLQIDGIDDLETDDHVEVAVTLGEGRPYLSAEGRLVEDQTFGLKEGASIGRGAGTIEEGVLLAGPFEVTFPINVFNVFFDLTLRNAFVRLTHTPDRGWEGVLTGGVAQSQIVSVARMADAMQEVQIGDQVAGILPLFADLESAEGEPCSDLSAVFKIETIPAFLYPEAEEALSVAP